MGFCLKESWISHLLQMLAAWFSCISGWYCLSITKLSVWMVSPQHVKKLQFFKFSGALVKLISQTVKSFQGYPALNGFGYGLGAGFLSSSSERDNIQLVIVNEYFVFSFIGLSFFFFFRVKLKFKLGSNQIV